MPTSNMAATRNLMPRRFSSYYLLITSFNPNLFNNVGKHQIDAEKHKTRARITKTGLIFRPLIWMLMFCLFLKYNMRLLTEADVLFEALHNTRRRCGRHASETHMMLTGIPSSRKSARLAHHRHARQTRVTWKYQTLIRSGVRTSRIVRKMVRDLGIVYNVTELVRWPITTRLRKIYEAACVAIVGEALMARRPRPPAADRSCIAARSAQPHSRAHDLGIELGNGLARRGAAASGEGGGASAGPCWCTGSCTAPLPPSFRHRLPSYTYCDRPFLF